MNTPPFAAAPSLPHAPAHPAAPDAQGEDEGEELGMFAFTPVPHIRARANGWTPAAQRGFIRALAVMGSVGMAARSVGMGRRSAYRLRERALKMGGGAERFAAAWDCALTSGRMRQFAVAMERVMEGETIIRVHRGGSVRVTGGPDMRVLNAALRVAPAPRRPIV